MGELNFILAVFLKPLVLLVDELVLFPLWKIRQRSGVKLLMAAIIVFLIGELFCARDVYILRRMTYFDEAGHDIFMLGAFSLSFAAFFYLFRQDFACWSKACPVLRGLASAKEKITTDKCVQKDLGVFAGWVLLFLAIVALMPVFAQDGVLRTNLDVSLFGRHIATFLYDRTPELSFLQQKVFPLVSCLLLIVSGILCFGQRRISDAVVWLGSFGIGALAFTYFRLILVHLFHPQAIFTAFWEELLELLYIGFIFLWIKVVTAEKTAVT